MCQTTPTRRVKYYALQGSLNWEAVRFHLLMLFLEPCGSRKDASYKNTFNSFYCFPLPAASFVFICRFAASAKRDRNGVSRYRRIFLFQSIRFLKRIIANGNCLMYDIPSSPNIHPHHLVLKLFSFLGWNPLDTFRKWLEVASERKGLARKELFYRSEC